MKYLLTQRIKRLSIAIRAITSFQIAIYLMATWAYLYYEGDGFDALGYQVLFGLLFVIAGIINLVLITIYLIYIKKQKQRIDTVGIILLSILIVLILAAFTFSG